MLRYAADESFNDDILRGLRRRDKALDRVRVQDVGLSGAADPDILAWAASKGRIALTHDVQTMVRGREPVSNHGHSRVPAVPGSDQFSG